MRLTAAQRRALPASAFALPPDAAARRRGFRGRVPIEDPGHAHSALGRLSQMRRRGKIPRLQYDIGRELALAELAQHRPRRGKGKR